MVVTHVGVGQLFNKEPLFEALLASKEGRTDMPAIISHVKSLKDCHKLNLTSVVKEKEEDFQFACPVTNLAMNGSHKFVYFLTCGCVVSQRAMKEAPSDNCLLVIQCRLWCILICNSAANQSEMST